MVDIQRLVEIDLAPVFELDPDLPDEIADRIDAEIALHGYDPVDITEQQAVLVALLTTKAFIPRLLLKFAQELRRARGGAAEAEFQDAIKYLQALRDELQGRYQEALSDLGEDLPPGTPPWPGVGVQPW
jgi:hypothetical protein